MKSLLLMSIIFVTLALPVLAARGPNPRRAMKRMLVSLLVFNAAYVAYLTRLHVTLFVPHR